MWVLIRAITYSSLFIGVLLVFLPVRVLSWTGITPIPTIGVWQVRRNCWWPAWGPQSHCGAS